MSNDTKDIGTESESPMIDFSIVLSAVAVAIICCYTGKKVFTKFFELQTTSDITTKRDETEPEGREEVINIPDYQLLRDINLSRVRGTFNISGPEGTISSDGSNFSYIDVVDNQSNAQRYYQNVSLRRDNTTSEDIIAQERIDTSQTNILLSPSRLISSNPPGRRPQYQNQAEESYFVLESESSPSYRTH
jgi:hypothetical protein